jgi:hypothetical protein
VKIWGKIIENLSKLELSFDAILGEKSIGN